MIRVVAAVIEREDKILICRRKAWQAHPLKWEFPGGKVEAGETPDQALRRELQEELAIQDATGSEIMRYHYVYPGKPTVELIFYRVLSFTGEPRNLVFDEMRWEPPAALAGFDFLEGDREFLALYCGARAQH